MKILFSASCQLLLLLRHLGWLCVWVCRVSALCVLTPEHVCQSAHSLKFGRVHPVDSIPKCYFLFCVLMQSTTVSCVFQELQRFKDLDETLEPN